MKKEERKRTKKVQKKKGNILSTIIIAIAASVFVFSLFMLVDSLAPYFEGGQEYDEVRKLVIKQEVVETEEGENQQSPSCHWCGVLLQGEMRCARLAA